MKHLREFLARMLPAVVKFAEPIDFGPCQFVKAVAITGGVSVLGHSVTVIVEDRPKEQMIGAHTEAVVTVVQDPHALRDRPEMDFPRYTVRETASFCGSPVTEHTVDRLAWT